MVPGHPPCALISLIFSSLDPETNCFVKSLYVFIFRLAAFRLPHFRFPITPFCNWPFLESFLCCAVVKVHPLAYFLPYLPLPFGFLPILGFSAYGQSLFHFWNRALKAIQTKLCNLLNSFPDALCVLCDRRSGLRTRILMLRCCCSSFERANFVCSPSTLE